MIIRKANSLFYKEEVTRSRTRMKQDGSVGRQNIKENSGGMNHDESDCEDES